MAISDVLWESAAQIREYLHVRPEAYAHVKLDLDILLTDMDRIREELDTPPKADQ